MRPRKERLPLTLDSLTALMIPGKSYTTVKLSLIFEGSPDAIAAVLTTLIAADKVRTALPECGTHRDRRKERQIYWIPAFERTDVAMRRTGPAEIGGELRGYDLSAFQRLAMASRR